MRVDDSDQREELRLVPPALLKAIFNTDFAILNALHDDANSGLAPRVPPEILEVIFDLVRDDGAGVGTLASVAQACRSFSHHATPTLYRTVIIYSGPTLDTRVGRFATVVTSNARLASFVRAIVIGRKTGPDAQSTSRPVLGVYASILRACKRLDALDISSNETMMAGFGRALQAAPSVTRLAIRELHASTWLQLLEHSAPSIRQLHLDNIYTAAFLGILHPTFHPHVFPRLITFSGFFDHTTALGRVYAFFRAPVLEKAALFIETSGIPNIHIDQLCNEERVLLWEKLTVWRGYSPTSACLSWTGIASFTSVNGLIRSDTTCVTEDGLILLRLTYKNESSAQDHSNVGNYYTTEQSAVISTRLFDPLTDLQVCIESPGSPACFCRG